MPTGKGNTTSKKILTPLSFNERGSWNNFLRFVYKNGYYGSQLLDQRNTSLGMSLMDKYNASPSGKLNPVSYDMVPRVQAEFQYLRQNGVFPGYQNNPYADAFKKFIHSIGIKDTLSPTDGWFGSLTSQEAYPEITDSEGHNWGINYDAFFKSMSRKYPISNTK